MANRKSRSGGRAGNKNRNRKSTVSRKNMGSRDKKNVNMHRGRMLIMLLAAAATIILVFNMLHMIFGGRQEGDPEKIAIAMVNCAEYSTFDYTDNYSMIENIGDGAGYTGGIIGFTTMTGDMLQVVKQYCEKKPDSKLKKYIPALAKAVGTEKTKGLGKGYINAWKKAGKDEDMRDVQDSFRDRLFLEPSFKMAKKDGLSTLGKYIYYDTSVQHGPEGEGSSMMKIRDAARKKVKTPADGGNEKKYLKEYLDIREKALKKLKIDLDTSRIEVQKHLVEDEEFEMLLPLEFEMYGQDFELDESDLI